MTMSSYCSDAPNSNLIPEALVPSATSGTNGEDKMKLDQAVIYAIPFCLVVLFASCFIYLRRRRNRRRSINNVDWITLYGGRLDLTNNISMLEFGLRKELRERLPTYIFGESFVRDSRCSVCLADYQTGERLQQIPECGHMFHMECIDTWLTLHATCPLCRVSLIPRVPQDRSHQSPYNVPSMENSNTRASAEPESQSTSEAIIQIDDGQ